MSYVPKKSKKPYSLEADIEKKGAKKKTKLTESVKSKKAKDKKKADDAKKKEEKGNWLDRLKAKYKQYKKDEAKK
jgi:hypothetical protein